MALYDNPALYDALFPISAACVELYVDLARHHGGDVLELACGTGQLLVPLAATGRPTVGLDSAAPMLEAARDRLAAAGASAELVAGDMRSFQLPRRFAVIVVARNSLLHLESAEELIAALRTARTHLAPGGVVAFDVFQPNIELLARPAGTRVPVMTAHAAGFGEITVEQTCAYDAAAQVQRGTWHVSTSGGDAWSFPLHLRSIFPQELPLLLAAAGLALDRRFGDYTRVPFTATSPRQVCVASACD